MTSQEDGTVKVPMICLRCGKPRTVCSQEGCAPPIPARRTSDLDRVLEEILGGPRR